MPRSICQKNGHDKRTCKSFNEIQKKNKSDSDSDSDSDNTCISDSEGEDNIKSSDINILNKELSDEKSIVDLNINNLNLNDSEKKKKTFNLINHKIIRIESIIRMQYLFLDYTKKIIPLIDELYQRKTKEYVHESTFFGDNSKENIIRLEIAFKQKQKQMKEGELAQIVIGNWFGWEDLGVGHSSGLDCRKKDMSIIMEIKNKWNTCNSGSQKALFDKLSEYKKNNPKTRCVWAIVNPKPDCKNLYDTINYNGVEIEKIQGKELFKLVFNVGNIDYSTQIINIIMNYISKY